MTETKTIAGSRSRFAATLFNYGNIISMLAPLPLGIFWLGASMAVYTMNRHHPNARVGHYTQQAAYRFYGVIGFIVVVATFYGTELNYWLITWAISAAVLLPWSIIDIVRIHREQWQDITIEAQHT